MSDLDNLRQEVREAVAHIDAAMDGYAPGDECRVRVEDCMAIRAELLRLASTEAELAALKARTAEAQKCSVVALCGGGASLSHEPYDSLIGHRVALVKVGNELTGEHADSMEEWARRKVEE